MMHLRAGTRKIWFCVGRCGELSSSVWKLWLQGDEVYLVQSGIAQGAKFSFHKSGKCRWALNQDIVARGGGDRAMQKWDRDPIPTPGTGRASILIRLAFPTRHLATVNLPTREKIYWILPAPDGKAVGITVSLTREPVARVRELVESSENEEIVFISQTRSGATVLACRQVFDCGVVELDSPGGPRVPGQVFGDLNFPHIDDRFSGRPIRLVVLVGKEGAPTLWEYGGYEVAKFEPKSSQPKDLVFQRHQ